jgi:hypothetical protein
VWLGLSGFSLVSFGFLSGFFGFLWFSLRFLWVIETTGVPEKPEKKRRETTEKPQRSPEKPQRRETGALPYRGLN